MIRQTCLAIIAVSALGWTASAQAQDRVFYVGPTFGIQTANGASESDQLWGASARLKLMPLLGVEGSAAYRQDEMSSGSGWVKTWPLMVTGMIYPISFLYGGVGGGWHHTTYDFSNEINDLGYEDQTNGDFGWHLALGAEIPAAPWLKLMADVRWVYMDSSPSDFPDIVDEELTEDFRLISFGLLFGL